VTTVYQPVVRVGAEGRAHEVVGFEALARWHDDVIGTVRPDEFIAVAEQSYLINRLGDRVLRRALVDLAQWRTSGAVGDDVTMSVNVSPRQLTRPRFAEVVATTLAHVGLPAPCLCIEITEQVMVENLDVVGRVLDSLAALGVRIALDDFGRGAFSFLDLGRLPLSRIKVDRSLVVAVGHPDRDTAPVVAAIAALANSLRLECVLEGVEDDDHLALMAPLGVDLIQGFVFARPMTAADAGRFRVRSSPSRDSAVPAVAIAPAS
jgi:EAL domain-containing protein (putative c-di-GMP-specific phosphodiesterase class I)